VKGGRKWRAACGAAFFWLVLGEKPKEGGAGLYCEALALGFFYLFFFQNCPLFLCVLKATICRKKMLLGLTLGPSTSFFVNFDFSYFFVFFKNEQYQH